MNTAEINERPRRVEKTDSQESNPFPGYEMTVLNWLEQLQSVTSVDELKELEEI
jgi:hypothetical protein